MRGHLHLSPPHPLLNANLVSISVLDKAGLTTTFGNGKGVVQKADGTTVPAGKRVNGMYLLDEIRHTISLKFTIEIDFS